MKIHNFILLLSIMICLVGSTIKLESDDFTFASTYSYFRGLSDYSKDLVIKYDNLLEIDSIQLLIEKYDVKWLKVFIVFDNFIFANILQPLSIVLNAIYNALVFIFRSFSFIFIGA